MPGVVFGCLAGVAAWGLGDASVQQSLGWASVGAAVAVTCTGIFRALSSVVHSPGFFWRRMTLLTTLPFAGLVVGIGIEVALTWDSQDIRLSGLKDIRICTAYRLGGQSLDAFPADSDTLAAVEPVFDTLPGWTEDLRHIRDFEELPRTAREYVLRLEQLVGVHVSIISVGPDRNDTIFRPT